MPNIDSTLLCALCVLGLSITHFERSLAFGTKRVEAFKDRLRSRRQVAPTLNTNVYYSYDEMLAYLEGLNNSAYSQRVAVKDLGRSYENRPLRAITITNGDGRAGKKAIFVAAGEHAREWLTPVAALYTVEQLVVNYEQNAHLLRDHDWIIMPLVNPDGYTYSRNVDKWWRKTRSPNGGNCFGTNINRNYDINWGQGYVEMGDPCSEHYDGSAPFSEPETRAVGDIMLDLVQNRRALMFISLHSHHTSITHPWIYTNSTPANVAMLREVAMSGIEAIRKATGTIFTCEGDGLFGGTSLDYAYSVGFPLSFAFELAEERRGYKFDFHPPTELLKELADESWVGIRGMAEKAIQYSNSVGSHSQKFFNLTNIIQILTVLTMISFLT